MDEDENIDPVEQMNNEGPTQPAPAIDYQKMFESMQQTNAQLMQQNQQLAVTVQQVANRPVTTPVNEPDPFAAFNPETKAALKAALDSQAKQFSTQLAQTQAQFANMSLEQEAASIALTPGLTAEQITRAQNIFRGNRAKNIPIMAAECIDVVLGADFRAGKIKIGDRAPPTTLNGGSRPPAPKPPPANLSKLSRREQIKFYESMEGFHDVRIEGITDNEE